MNEDLVQSPIEIIGAGASGRALAFLFLQSGRRVRLLSKTGPVDHIKVVVEGDTKEIELPVFKETAHISLLTVPAFALKSLHGQYGSLKNKLFLPLSNGFYGPELASPPFYPGVNYVASTYDRNRETVEIFSSTPGLIVQKVLEMHFPHKPSFLEFTTGIQSKLAAKFLVNLVLNTLSAAYDLDQNSQCAQQKNFEGIITESIALTNELYGFNCAGFPNEQSAKNYLSEVLKKLGQNTNSMVQALRRGSRTEAEYLSGHANSNTYPILFELHQMIVSKSKHT